MLFAHSVNNPAIEKPLIVFLSIAIAMVLAYLLYKAVSRLRTKKNTEPTDSET